MRQGIVITWANWDVEGARSLMRAGFRNNQTRLISNKYTVKGMFQYTQSQSSHKRSATVGLAYE